MDTSGTTIIATPANTNFIQTAVPATQTEFVLQSGPENGKDIWTTDIYSYAPCGGGPGGGLDNYELRVGGYGDSYYALLQFDFTNMPKRASKVVLYLYNVADQGSPTGMCLDRITKAWNWVAGDRLWWKDKPTATQVSTVSAPQVNAWREIDITDLYNKWQSGEYPNYGIQLRPQCTSNKIKFVIVVSVLRYAANSRPKKFHPELAATSFLARKSHFRSRMRVH